MRKFITTIVLMVLSFQVFSSTVESVYSSSSNPHYWKNKKPFEGYWQQDVHYIIDAVVNEEEESISGEQTLIYTNNSPDTLNEVYFHLYQNAFTPGSYAHELRKSGKLQTVFGEHEAKGLGTVIKKFQVDGADLSFELDYSILHAELQKPLLPGASITFAISFTTYWDKDDEGNIRRRMKTFKHSGYTHFDGVHWYPRISVYDRKFGWTTDQHLGKEFYGDFGQFDVSLTFPNQYIVEATGTLQNRSEVMPDALREELDLSNYKTERSFITEPVKADGTTKTWQYHAINVHDFAFTADPTYRIGEVEWNGIKCVAIAMEEHAHLWQGSAEFVAKVIEVYHTDFGEYIYPKIVAADARDGMEYPMITLDGGTFPGHKGLLAHEIGHNWYFGMIGNNETYRASLDEGFTQFLTAWSMKKIHNADVYGNPYDKYTVFNSYLNHASLHNSAVLETHSDYFNSAERHGGGYSQVYYKTATMLYNLQYVLGDELFLQAMQHYTAQWKVCHPYWEDFRTSIIRFTKVDLNWFFDQWLNTNKKIDYAVGRIRKDGEEQVVTIKRKTSMHMPLDISVEFTDGSTEQHYVPNTYFSKETEAVEHKPWIGWDEIHDSYELRVKTDKKIKKVQIDPSSRLADVNKLNNCNKTATSLSFSKYRTNWGDFDKYKMAWEPKVWFNGVDGIKVGVGLNGNYANYLHRFDLNLWYNTGVAQVVDIEGTSPFNYDLNYQTQIGHLLDLTMDSRWLDGANINSLGIKKYANRSTYYAFFKSLYRNGANNLSYLIYKELWNNNLWNNSLNLGVTRRYKYYTGSGSFDISTRASAIASDYNYGFLRLEQTNDQKLGKLNLKTRVFGQLMSGVPAPESSLTLAGANNEEMMDNPWVRSVGFVPESWEGFGNDIGHFHYGGGLNIRGYSGYLATNSNESDTIAIFSGLSGWAVNVELDFSKFTSMKGALSKFMSFSPYLFADAGMLYTNSLSMNSGFRADAGLGMALTLNTRPKAVTIRCDMPFFINRIPPGQSDYFAFRYVFGISRAF